jgi:hypothetical protein
MTTSNLSDKAVNNADVIISWIIVGALVGCAILTSGLVLYKFMTGL